MYGLGGRDYLMPHERPIPQFQRPATPRPQQPQQPKPYQWNPFGEMQQQAARRGYGPQLQRPGQPSQPAPPTAAAGLPTAQESHSPSWYSEGYDPPKLQQQPQQQPGFAPMFTPQQTQESVARALAAANQTTLPMLMQGAQRSGIRADSMIPSVLPQYAQSQAAGALAAQQIPFQHAAMNAGNLLGLQNTGWNEALGFANAGLNAQNHMNQWQLGNMNALADFFRLFF